MAASTSTLPLKPLTIAQEDHIIEARALNDERAIRKTLRNILTLERRALQSAASKDVEITLPGEGVPKAEEKEKDKETYALFGGELKNVELHVKKAGVVGKMEARMRETYAAKGKEIERKQPQHTQDIVMLREKLRNAEEERKQKMEYDETATQILSIGRRDDLETAIEEKQNTLSALALEKERILQSLSRRSAVLNRVIDELARIDSSPSTPKETDVDIEEEDEDEGERMVEEIARGGDEMEEMDVEASEDEPPKPPSSDVQMGEPEQSALIQPTNETEPASPASSMLSLPPPSSPLASTSTSAISPLVNTHSPPASSSTRPTKTRSLTPTAKPTRSSSRNNTSSAAPSPTPEAEDDTVYTNSGRPKRGATVSQLNTPEPKKPRVSAGGGRKKK